jgi:hypothetical protein
MTLQHQPKHDATISTLRFIDSKNKVIFSITNTYDSSVLGPTFHQGFGSYASQLKKKTEEAIKQLIFGVHAIPVDDSQRFPW